MRLSTFLSLFILLFACDPNVEFENINPENLISVTCFISPQDSVFTAYLYRASPLGSTIKTDSASVKDAEVTISDGQNYDTLFLTSELDTDSNRRIYRYSGTRKHLTISTNSSYLLEVKAPQGIHATATCTIPAATESVQIIGAKFDDDYKFTIEWNNPDLHKYFLLVLEAKGSYENPFPGATGRIDLRPSLIEEIIFPSDKQGLSNKYEAMLPYAYLADYAHLKVSVRNIDAGLYKYFKNYQQFEKWDLNNSGNIFPNFKDVPLIYSNINGAVGIFGGFNSSSETVIIN